jgi:hypothetical protein
MILSTILTIFRDNIMKYQILSVTILLYLLFDLIIALFSCIIVLWADRMRFRLMIGMEAGRLNGWSRGDNWSRGDRVLGAEFPYSISCSLTVKGEVAES